jgi:putative nucleotidyltransferase with HDIG domain
VPRIRLDGYGETAPRSPGVAATAPVATLAGEYVNRDIEQAIRRLPPLPTTLGDLVHKLNNPDSSVRDITSRIRTDPSLTTRLLRMANSAFYATRTHITEVERAVVVLGFRTTRNVVAAAAVASHYCAFQHVHGFAAQGMYRHSLAAAIFAQMLAVEANVGGLTPEEYFVAGLLHDIGRIPLAQHYRRHRPEFEAAPYEIAAQHALEGELFGTDHAAVGGMVAEHWRLPEVYHRIVTGHHDPAVLAQDRFTALVALAERCVNAAGIGRSAPFAAQEEIALLTTQAGVAPELVAEATREHQREFQLYLTAL